MEKLKTKAQIKKKLKEIQKERSVIRQFSAFGDNNWESMDLQIKDFQWVLSHHKKETIQSKIREIEREFHSTDDEKECERQNDLRYAFEWCLNIVSD